MYFNVPPIVHQHAPRRVPEDWQRSVQRIRADAWVIFNPVIGRYAIVACTGSPHAYDFCGYGYPGVMWLMNIRHPDGSPRGLDDGVLAEFWERHHRGLRDSQRDRDRHSFSRDTTTNRHFTSAEKAKKKKLRKEVSDTTTAAISEVFEPAMVGRVTTTPAGTIDYGEL